MVMDSKITFESDMLLAEIPPYFKFIWQKLVFSNKLGSIKIKKMDNKLKISQGF